MTIGVYGLGRFGSFWASLLARKSTVYVCSRSAHEAPQGTSLIPLEGLGECDAVFLCPAISSIPEVCRLIAPHLHAGQTILDTCSVKVWPLEQMQRLLPPEVSLVGTHPMFGPDSARSGHSGLPLVLSPVAGRSVDGTGKDLVSFWELYFKELDLSVKTMTADEHDREAARTQGLTHLLGRILAQMECTPSDMATLGYRKLLEIMGQTCNDPWQLFLDLQGKNPYTDQVRKDLRSAMDTIYGRLEQETTRVEE